MPVRVKLDEDLPVEIAEVMRVAGHVAETVHGQGFSGFSDDRLWPEVQREARMLLTADKGFANAKRYPPGTHGGIVLFRLPRESRAGYVRLANVLIERVRLEDIVGAIATVSPDVIRVRRSRDDG